MSRPEGSGIRVYRYAWTLDTVRDRCEIVGDCWLWKQAFTSSGLPQATIQGRGGCSVRTFVFDELMRKVRPAKSTIAARCNDNACVSPHCLYFRSRSSVVKASHASGARQGTDTTIMRRARAVKQGLSKLDQDKAREIREQVQTRSKADLARAYGVSPNTIRKIIRNEIWAPMPANSVFNLASTL